MNGIDLRLDEPQILPFLESLKKLHCPESVVHVGVGQGMGPMHVWRHWDIEKALLLDLAETPSRWLEKALSEQADWNYQSALVAHASDEVNLFTASNPAESGLLDPKELTRFWPHIKCVEENQIEAETLDDLTSKFGIDLDWLIVDCLPAIQVVKGAAKALEICSVILARVSLDPSEEDDLISFDALAHHLGKEKFSPVAFWEENQPLLGSVVFVRDWHLQFKAAQKSAHRLKDEFAQQQKVLESRIESLQGENLALTQTKDQWLIETDAIRSQKDLAESRARELEAKIVLLDEKITALEAEAARGVQERETLRQERAELATQRDALLKEKSDLVADKDAEVAALNTEKKGLIEARDVIAQERTALEASKNKEIQALIQEKNELTKAHDQHAASALERQSQLEQLNQAIEAERNAKEQAIAERDTERTVKAETESRIGELESEKLALIATRDALAQENHALTVSRDTQITSLNEEKDQLRAQLNEREQALADLSSAIETETRVKSEALTRLSSLEKEYSESVISSNQKAQLARELQAQIEDLTKALDSEALAKDQATAQLESLNAELEEYQYRRELINEEMLRAEAQLDLIKDILLREPGL